MVGFLNGLDKEDAEADGEDNEQNADTAKAARQHRIKQLLLPILEPLSVPLLAQVERCAAGEGGAVAGGRALIPTPLQVHGNCSISVWKGAVKSKTARNMR